MATSTEHRDRAAASGPVIAWSLAAALFWGCIDISQVVVATGGQQVLRLAAMAASLYALLGVSSGAVLAMLARRLLPAALATNAALASLAWVGWGLLVVGTYVNVVHLPSITSPITLAANILGAVAAALLWLGATRVRWIARLSASSASALAVGAVAAAACLLVSRGWSQPAAPPRSQASGDKPNVFVIALDTLRYDRTALGSGDRSQTPNLDLLAAGGTAFTRAYAQSSWTKPSVASLFTSLYPSSHGANLRRDRLATQPLTIAELFARRGYRTAVFSANPWISPAFGFDRGVEYFYESERETFSRLVMLLRMLRAADRVLPGDLLRSGIRGMEDLYGLRSARATNCDRDTAIVDAFAEWLTTAPDQPAFAYFHLMSPHIPYEPPHASDAFAAPDQVALLQSSEALEAGRNRLLLSLYDGAVAHGDEELGRIVAVLRDHGILDRSVLVVTADHGEEFHEHGHWGHGKTLYDELTRVPLVLAGPGIAAGIEAAGPAMLVDILPTAAALLGVPPDPSWEGSPLSAMPPDRTAYAELIREGGLESYMIYRDGRKYVESTDGLGSTPRVELYDLRSDGAEQRPVADIDLSIWQRRLGEIRDAARSKSLARDQAVLDEAAQEKLEALGYFN